MDKHEKVCLFLLVKKKISEAACRHKANAQNVFYMSLFYVLKPGPNIYIGNIASHKFLHPNKLFWLG